MDLFSDVNLQNSSVKMGLISNVLELPLLDARDLSKQRRWSIGFL